MPRGLPYTFTRKGRGTILKTRVIYGKYNTARSGRG